jgi:hypothetical protein
MDSTPLGSFTGFFLPLHEAILIYSSFRVRWELPFYFQKYFAPGAGRGMLEARRSV